MIGFRPQIRTLTKLRALLGSDTNYYTQRMRAGQVGVGVAVSGAISTLRAWLWFWV